MMGCKMSFLPDLSSWGLAGLAVEEEKEGEVKQYSWDKLRVELDVSQYVIDKQEGGETVRRPGQLPQSRQASTSLPSRRLLLDCVFRLTCYDKMILSGSIGGQQFQIKNCTNCRIYLYDWSNTLTIDDCTNVKIFAAAVKTSVFMRDCNNCVLVTASGQLR